MTVRSLFRPTIACLLLSLLAPWHLGAASIEVQIGAETSQEGLQGRLLLMLSTDDTKEPRFQVSSGINAIQVFGMDVHDFSPGKVARFDDSVFGYPLESLARVPPGSYRVQALLHLYETFQRGDGHTVEMPMDRGEGQQWNRAPGNLFSNPVTVTLEPGNEQKIKLVLDRVIPPIEKPADTKYIRHVEIKSKLLSEFWGRDMFLGAHVLVPEGFDEHPEARYPLVINHGHFPADFGGFRTEPPDPDLECEYSARFNVECYNRIQQQEAYDFYQKWTGDAFPRILIVEIQHANPFYDDSYAVNSENVGPYGDAIMRELVPFIEQEFRGIGEGWARFTYGGSTGGWEAAAAQVFYPEEFNGAFIACPDPVDFRAYTLVNIYEDKNAYYREGPFRRQLIAGHRDASGDVDQSLMDYAHLELALGTKNRSGGQFDIWEAVYSPVGDDGYPQPLWDRLTGVIDPKVAEYWRENYDLRHILERDWATLGPKLEGKLHFYCGDMDNYYLNNAVKLMEAFLESTTNPYYGGVVEYGDGDEHCWNGDHENGNHLSRLRYHTMYLPRILERIKKAAPEWADLKSWRY